MKYPVYFKRGIVTEIAVGKIHRRHYNGNSSGVSDSHSYEGVNTGGGQKESSYGV